MSEETLNEGLAAVAEVAGGGNAAPGEPTPPASDGDNEYSIFADENFVKLKGKKKPYTMSIKLGKTKFFGVLLPRELCARYNRDILKLDRDGKRAQEQADVDEIALVEQTEAIAQRSVELAEGVIVRTIRDWENPAWANKPPCNAENLKRMTPEAKATLADEILAKSLAGRSRSGFLEAS